VTARVPLTRSSAVDISAGGINNLVKGFTF